MVYKFSVEFHEHVHYASFNKVQHLNSVNEENKKNTFQY